ncbi:MAG: hypothetical protein IJ056_09090 [Acidaminococcaceae bacterium]|nr:hypothetical protein [Acidaminococcaceae bacterium]MBR1589994.1 hypothetical protein [Acidaminococcaceae bacterium]
MSFTYKLEPVKWDLSGTRFSRLFNKGDLICNMGIHDLMIAMPERKFVGNLIIGRYWNPYDEPIIAIFMTEEMMLLERCMSAVGERLSYSAYMVADAFVISDENEFCNYKKFDNGIEVIVTGDLYQFIITVSFPYNIYVNRKHASGYNDHEVVVIVKDPKLVYPVIEYLTTTEGVGPNP